MVKKLVKPEIEEQDANVVPFAECQPVFCIVVTKMYSDEEIEDITF